MWWSVAHRRRLCHVERQPPAVDNALAAAKYSGKTKPGVAGLENHASGVDGGSLRDLLGGWLILRIILSFFEKKIEVDGLASSS